MSCLFLQEHVDRTFKVSKEFFTSPKEEKVKAVLNEETQHGYVPPEAELLDKEKVWYICA